MNAPRKPEAHASAPGLGWTLLRPLLMAAFFLLFTPVAFLARLLRMLPFTESFRRRPSYWKETRPARADKRHFERQS